MLQSFLRHKFLAPELASYGNLNLSFQYFSLLTAEQRSSLEERCNCGVSPEEFDKIIANLSDHPKSVVLLSTDKMKILKSNYIDFNNFHQVFAGEGSPVIDNKFVTFQVSNANMSVYWIFCMSIRFSNYVPLSTGCFDTKFFEIQVLEFIDIINKAVGKRGSFPGRSRA